jgi:HEAT repeat protein
MPRHPVFLFVLAVWVCGLAQADSDSRQRIRTARDLSKQGSEAIPKLAPMLSDPDSAVRIEAVKAIVDIDGPASVGPLVQATRDTDVEVQIRAADGLVNYYLPGYVRRGGLTASISRVGTAVKSKFTDTNDLVVPAYTQVKPEVVEALGHLVRNGGSMDCRANAARAAGILRGQAAMPDLIDALHSKDDQVMYESLIALQKIKDPSAGPRMMFLLRDLDPKVQLAAIDTAGLLRTHEALPALRGVLVDADDAKVKRAALSAIAMIPDPGSRDLYQRYIHDRDDGLRAAAAEGFARLKNPADEHLLANELKNDQRRPSQLAESFALVMLGHTEYTEQGALRFLVNTLNSAAWKGVAQAYLIEAARETAVRRTLERALKPATKDEKIQLLQILAASGDTQTEPYLDELSRDSDPDVASAALSASRTLKARLPN